MHGEHGAGGCGRGVRAGGPAAAARPFELPGARAHWPPDRPLALRHVALDLAVDLDRRTLDGKATLRLEARRATDGVRLDAVGLDVVRARRVDAGGEPARDLPFELAPDALWVRLPAPLAAGETVELEVAYRVVEPAAGLHFVGPDERHPGRPRQAWTQGQDEDARRWFPCLDAPSDRATSEVAVEAPPGFEALANGVLVEAGPGARAGWTRRRWRLDRPHPPYLLALVVAELVALEDASAAPPLRFLTTPARAHLAARAFAPTRAMLALLEGWTGTPFPWPRYDQVAVEGFTFGGMENTSQTTLAARALAADEVAEDHSSDPLVVHELAHQWFGDLLTCRDWSHAWLNEGFATWCEALWEEAARGREAHDEALLAMRELYLAEAGERYARPIVTRRVHAPIDLFDRHLYEKGALVLHGLRGLLGDDGMRAAVRAYVARGADGSVETVDLERAVFEATGRDVRAFLAQHVERAGHPVVAARWAHDPATGHGVVALEQTQEGEPFELALELVVVRGAERATQRVAFDGRRAALSLEGAAPDRVVLDPRGWALVELDLGDWPVAWLAETLEREADLLPRALAAKALGAHRAPGTARQAVAALGRALGDHVHWGVATRVARALGEVGTADARRALEAGLEDARHPRTRAAIARALGERGGDAAAADTLAAMLERDRSPLVEAAAARALGRTRAPGAIEKLAAALAARESWNDVVRRGCLDGLGASLDPAALDLALPWLAPGRDEQTRAAAARAVGALADAGGPGTRTRALDALAPLARDPELCVRLAAVEALAATGDDRAAPALERATRDDDDRVRRAAREALRALGEGDDAAGRAGRLRRDLEQAREEARALRDRVERLEAIVAARLPAPGPKSGLPGRPERGGPPEPGGGGEVLRGTDALQEG